MASSSAVSHVLLVVMPIEAGVTGVFAVGGTGWSATPLIWLIKFWQTPTGVFAESVTAIL